MQTWPGGFKAEITVTAAGSPVKGWQVSWTPVRGQTVRQAWNAAFTAAGGDVTARSLDYNMTLRADATTLFGFVGNGPGTRPASAVTCRALG